MPPYSATQAAAPTQEQAEQLCNPTSPVVVSLGLRECQDARKHSSHAHCCERAFVLPLGRCCPPPIRVLPKGASTWMRSCASNVLERHVALCCGTVHDVVLGGCRGATACHKSGKSLSFEFGRVFGAVRRSACTPTECHSLSALACVHTCGEMRGGVKCWRLLECSSASVRSSVWPPFPHVCPMEETHVPPRCVKRSANQEPKHAKKN